MTVTGQAVRCWHTAPRTDDPDRARRVAQAQCTDWTPPPGEQVVYEVGRMVLLLGPAEPVARIAPVLAKEFRVLALVSDSTPAATPGWTALPGQIARLEGYQGAFYAAASRHGGGELDLGPLSQHADGHFDLVVDFSARPSFPHELSPLGYYHLPALHETEALLSQLRQHLGQQTKPRYFAYQADVCAHARQGRDACTRCLEVCPTGAISSAGEVVAVDPALCQGCGSCTQVCPSGALRPAYPDTAVLHDRLRRLLTTYRDAGGPAPGVLFHPVGTHLPAPLPNAWLPVPVHAIGMIGIETWLSALAYGASAVRLIVSTGTPHAERAALERNVLDTRAVLVALGMDPDQLAVIEAYGDALALPPVPAPHPGLRQATHAGLRDKRQALFLALDHLIGALAKEPTEPFVELAPGAAFGTVLVDPEHCTLCSACARLCPAQALGCDQDSLTIRESACVQCGLCVNVCPEQAIALHPRLLFDAEARGKARIVHRTTGYIPCRSCGAPVMTEAMWQALATRLANTAFFQAEQQRTLRLCEACRAQETLRESVL